MFGDKMNTTYNKEYTISKLAHEMKNPLTVCKGYLEMMSRSSRKDQARYIRIIEEEITNSLKILKSYSDSNKEKLTIESFSLTELIRELTESLNSLFQNQKSIILFKENNKNKIEGDFTKLKEVFVNIIKNAYESKDKESLLIHIQINKKEEYYEIHIKDNGCGMTKEQLENIEKKYYTTKKEGNGIGLPFCKEIIELHGGKITYSSKKNIGSLVSIILPVKQKSQLAFNNNDDCY